MTNEVVKKEKNEIVTTIAKGSVVATGGACGAAVGTVGGGGAGAAIGMAVGGPAGAAVGYGIGVLVGALGGGTAAGVGTKKAIDKITEKG